MILWNIYFKKYKYFIFWTISLPRWLRHSLHMIYYKCYRYNRYYFQSSWLINGITEEMSSLWPLIMFWLWQKQVALFKIILVSWFYFNCEKQPNWYGGVRVSNISCPIKNYLISWFYCNSERQPNWYAGQNPTGKDKSSGPIQNYFSFCGIVKRRPICTGAKAPLAPQDLAFQTQCRAHYQLSLLHRLHIGPPFFFMEGVWTNFCLQGSCISDSVPAPTTNSHFIFCTLGLNFFSFGWVGKVVFKFMSLNCFDRIWFHIREATTVLKYPPEIKKSTRWSGNII